MDAVVRLLCTRHVLTRSELVGVGLRVLDASFTMEQVRMQLPGSRLETALIELRYIKESLHVAVFTTGSN